jgi:anti-anti-sigma factor
MSAHRPVLILQLPEQLDWLGAQAFMLELEPLLDSQRPRMVFDCSEVHSLDGPGTEMMLHCLEATRKRGGDLKLASLSPESRQVLDLMPDAHGFESFRTSDEAVRSFAPLPAPGVLPKVSSGTNFFGETEALKKAS